jgi:hypothetical protein
MNFDVLNNNLIKDLIFFTKYMCRLKSTNKFINISLEVQL